MARGQPIDRRNNRRNLDSMLMGMESPDNRRRADDSYRALSRG